MWAILFSRLESWTPSEGRGQLSTRIIALCFHDCGCSVASCLRLLLPDFSTMMDSTLELLTETTPPALNWLCHGIFITQLRHIPCILQKVMGVEG